MARSYSTIMKAGSPIIFSTKGRKAQERTCVSCIERLPREYGYVVLGIGIFRQTFTDVFDRIDKPTSVMTRTQTEQAAGGAQRVRAIRRVLWGILILNIAVSAAKFFYGLITSSASMQADGIHSLFDATGNIIGIVGMTLAARPADAGHPYGHGKFETFASILVGVLLLLAAFKVGFDAASSLIAGHSAVEVTPLSFVVMFGTLAVNIFVTAYERRAAKRTNSEILAADAAHTLSDVLTSLGVIVGLLFVRFGFPLADSIAALVVSLLILYTAVGVFRQAINTLSDKARLPSADIKSIVCAHPGVAECHRIRTRGVPSEVYLDFHVLVSHLMTVGQAHELAERIEEDLHQAFPALVDVTIHIEPDNEKERREGTE